MHGYKIESYFAFNTFLELEIANSRQFFRDVRTARRQSRMHFNMFLDLERSQNLDYFNIDETIGSVLDRFYVVNGIGTIRSESGDTHPIWLIGLLEKGIRL